MMLVFDRHHLHHIRHHLDPRTAGQNKNCSIAAKKFVARHQQLLRFHFKKESNIYSVTELEQEAQLLLGLPHTTTSIFLKVKVITYKFLIATMYLTQLRCCKRFVLSRFRFAGLLRRFSHS